MEDKRYGQLLDLATTASTARLNDMCDSLEPFAFGTGSYPKASHLVTTFELEVLAREQRARAASAEESEKWG